LRGDWLTRTSSKTEYGLLIFAGIVFGFGLSLFRPLPAVFLAAVGGLAVAGAAQMLFNYDRIWFPWMIIVAAQIPIALLWSVVTNSVQLYVQNRLYEHSLRMYLPPKLVKKFSSNKELLKPGAKKQTLTLFFSDIADFTSISEGMDSDELAALMNAYFQSAVGDCIHKTDGTVVKYIGDAIFAFWNAPEGQADHAKLACEAALRFAELNEREIHGHHLHTRIGLHTGVANVGNFGSQERVDYTALGENVNLASRLEGLNKMLGTERLISGQTRAEVGDSLVTRALGSFQLKGFESLVEAHELVGWAGQAEASREWREQFAQALDQYQQRNLDLAQIGFRRVLEIRPDDGPSKFYLKQIDERIKQDASSIWLAHTIILEK
jgi:adenylate cyclase